MVQIVNSNKGISIIEVTVALALLLLVLLGLMQTLMLSAQVNIKNRLRDEAVKIAREELECTRNLLFDNVNNSICIANTNNIVTRRFRNFNAEFCLTKTVTSQGNVKRIELNVHWNYRKLSSQYTCGNNSYEYRYATSTILK